MFQIINFYTQEQITAAIQRIINHEELKFNSKLGSDCEVDGLVQAILLRLSSH